MVSITFFTHIYQALLSSQFHLMQKLKNEVISVFKELTALQYESERIQGKAVI